MYKINDNIIIDNFNNSKFLKKDMRKIVKEMIIKKMNGECTEFIMGC